MDKRSRRDLLSDLPLGILHTILAFVPIRDAVKTSILSRQWRYIWATLPNLVFEDEDERESDKTSLCHFINQALLLHRGPIYKFKLYVPSVKSCCIDQWLLFLSRNDIRILFLNAEEEDDDDDGGVDNLFPVHSSIYSCENLIQLELFNCEIPPPPPTFNGFLCLRSLVLEYVEVPCKAIESIVARSPLLEEFKLTKCYGILEFRIHAPNLKCLAVTGDCEEILSYVPLLSKLSATFFNMIPEQLQQKNLVCNYMNFLDGFTNIQELNGDGFFIKYLSIGVKSYHCSLVFHRLRVIEVSGVNFNDIKEIWVIVRLIMGAPNLHKLKIKDTINWQIASYVESLWDSKGAPSFTFERLKVIKIRDVFGGLHEMKFVEFMLESSPVLETMTYVPNPRIQDHHLLTLTAELLRYRRASANAKIFFNHISSR